MNGAIYYHHDHLGGVVLETDEHGAVVREASFDPYGGDLQAAADAPYAFTGKERDPDTGLYDFGARVYDPKLGLFLSPDPAPLERPRARRRRPAAALDLRLRPQQPDQPHRPRRPTAPHPRRRPRRRLDRRRRLPRQGRRERQLLRKALGGAAAGGAVSRRDRGRDRRRRASSFRAPSPASDGGHARAPSRPAACRRPSRRKQSLSMQ